MEDLDKDLKSIGEIYGIAPDLAVEQYMSGDLVSYEYD
jgi:hypothetical protein